MRLIECLESINKVKKKKRNFDILCSKGSWEKHKKGCVQSVRFATQYASLVARAQAPCLVSLWPWAGHWFVVAANIFIISWYCWREVKWTHIAGDAQMGLFHLWLLLAHQTHSKCTPPASKHEDRNILLKGSHPRRARSMTWRLWNSATHSVAFGLSLQLGLQAGGKATQCWLDSLCGHDRRKFYKELTESDFFSF